MTTVNPNIVNETKSDIFSWTHSNLTSSFIGHTILKYFNGFYNCIFQFHCKNECKQVPGNKIKGGMCKSDSTFPYLQRATLFT